MYDFVLIIFCFFAYFVDFVFVFSDKVIKNIENSKKNKTIQFL